MYRRDHHVNIPTEVLRTVAAIVDTGSFTRAGERLGLSQPGISAQVKRLQVLVGGPVFERTTGGVTLTEKGKLLLPLAQAVLRSNDQILCLGGSSRDPRPVRIGISDVFAPALLRTLAAEQRRDLHIQCDGPDEIAKGLGDGYLDIACMLKPPRDLADMVETWQETLVWVRSRDFVVSPGDPIPVVAWPGCVSDRVALDALRSRGVGFRIAFASNDHATRLAAVASGLGVMVLPERCLDPAVMVASEYYLPPLPTVEAGICVRLGFEAGKVRKLLAALASLDRPRAPALSVAS